MARYSREAIRPRFHKKPLRETGASQYSPSMFPNLTNSSPDATSSSFSEFASSSSSASSMSDSESMLSRASWSMDVDAGMSSETSPYYSDYRAAFGNHPQDYDMPYQPHKDFLDLWQHFSTADQPPSVTTLEQPRTHDMWSAISSAIHMADMSPIHAHNAVSGKGTAKDWYTNLFGGVEHPMTSLKNERHNITKPELQVVVDNLHSGAYVQSPSDTQFPGNLSPEEILDPSESYCKEDGNEDLAPVVYHCIPSVDLAHGGMTSISAPVAHSLSFTTSPSVELVEVPQELYHDMARMFKPTRLVEFTLLDGSKGIPLGPLLTSKVQDTLSKLEGRNEPAFMEDFKSSKPSIRINVCLMLHNDRRHEVNSHVAAPWVPEIQPSSNNETFNIRGQQVES
ncbi:hypothetical protein WOLCODRAFT_15995 [Wolfiporia cocos MD-104 SS10]|uniref:Uncharacterized protein n=1 Tax=Wolfiporia cocos (strain MD-104) TaxID=742152 RepID=A0A2H3JAP4_WOLCO|nr:hypothetical protein WOLCODRAFT_15995 [Wolfiporia cocos MD-104 SS10]